MAVGLRYGVELRSAQPADAPELARLLAEAGLPVSAKEAAARLEAMRARPDCAVLVATGYAGLAGLVSASWAPGLGAARPVARVGVLVVDDGERRHGIGRMLLKAASQAARSGGCDMLEMAGAEAFCLANGFTPSGAVWERSLRKRGGE